MLLIYVFIERWTGYRYFAIKTFIVYLEDEILLVFKIMIFGFSEKNIEKS